MVTSLYPLPTKENNCTYVCHFFTREWVKMGYRVLVIHKQPVHCFLWHLCVRWFGGWLKSRYGGGNFYARKIKEIEHYDMDGVQVYRVPIYSFIPHLDYPWSSVRHFTNKVFTITNDLNFKPDVILGHSTQLQIIPELNKKYKTKTVMISHGPYFKIRKSYKNWEELVDSFDVWGFRSTPTMHQFEIINKKIDKTFICFSGIPESFIAQRYRVHMDKPISRFIFIGELIERKYPIALLEAIPRVCDKYSIEIIGAGAELNNLKKYSIDHNLSNVLFTGKVPREQIREHLDNSDCFIMISKGEAFGLVYLEAMARGCIVIASKGGGMDGVIIDGINGFLSEEGSSEHLSEVIEKINTMDEDRLLNISRNAIDTARQMTDKLMASDYIHKVEVLLK